VTTNVTREAERAAAAVRSVYRLTNPPVDVHSLAWQFGISEILVKGIVGDGRLETRGREGVIVVQAKAGRPRQRFTIAHELGHLWLQRANGRLPPLDHEMEERFCNVFAAALLLPFDWARLQAHLYQPTLQALRSIADEANASLACCLIRLRACSADWRRCTLVSWRWDDGAWRMASVTGMPRELGGVTTVSRTRRALDVVARTKADSLGPALWLRVGASERQVPAEIAVRGSGAVALVELPSPVAG
jgi:hypothetical protein